MPRTYNSIATAALLCVEVLIAVHCAMVLEDKWDDRFDRVCILLVLVSKGLAHQGLYV